MVSRRLLFRQLCNETCVATLRLLLGRRSYDHGRLPCAIRSERVGPLRVYLQSSSSGSLTHMSIFVSIWRRSDGLCLHEFLTFLFIGSHATRSMGAAFLAL